jgi:iron-sulfur cluster assembly accessory protein
MIAATTNSSNVQPNFRVGDERLVRVTASAAKKVGALLTRQGRPNGVLRVAVVGGGCSGLQYKMDLQDGPANRDILVESAGIKVVVDPKSALYVSGSELDYVDALQGGGFKVKNPNAASSCSCGESFSA